MGSYAATCWVRSRRGAGPHRIGSDRAGCLLCSPSHCQPTLKALRAAIVELLLLMRPSGPPGKKRQPSITCGHAIPSVVRLLCALARRLTELPRPCTTFQDFYYFLSAFQSCRILTELRAQLQWFLCRRSSAGLGIGIPSGDRTSRPCCSSMQNSQRVFCQRGEGNFRVSRVTIYFVRVAHAIAGAQRRRWRSGSRVIMGCSAVPVCARA
jgi:hypothetical protein